MNKTNNGKKYVVAEQLYNATVVSGPSHEFQSLIRSGLSSKFVLVPLVYNRPINVFDRKESRFYKTKVSELHPDLFVARGIGIDGLKAINGAKKAGCTKILMGIHGFPSDEIKQSRIKRFIKHVLIEIPSIRKSTSFYTVCNDAFTTHPWLKRYKNKYVGRIYNSVANIDKNNISRIKKETRYQLGLDTKAIVGIYTGRIVEDKGIAFLCDSLNKFFEAEESNNFVFLFVGDGPYLSVLKNRCSKLIESRKIIVVGPQKDVWPFLLSSDLFVFPSLRENHPLSILEACEADLFIISTDVGGIKETVLPGVNAMLIKPGDSDVIYKALVSVVKNQTYAHFDKTQWPKYKLGRFDQATLKNVTGSIYESIIEDRFPLNGIKEK
jgi:glycosyltransferase involved in cell wall biosynthesis